MCALVRLPFLRNLFQLLWTAHYLGQDFSILQKSFESLWPSTLLNDISEAVSLVSKLDRIHTKLHRQNRSFSEKIKKTMEGGKTEYRNAKTKNCLPVILANNFTPTLHNLKYYFLWTVWLAGKDPQCTARRRKLRPP